MIALSYLWQRQKTLPCFALVVLALLFGLIFEFSRIGITRRIQLRPLLGEAQEINGVYIS